MTIEKLKSAIQFKECETSYGHKSIHARLEIGASKSYDPDASSDVDELVKYIKEELRYLILKMLYEDQRDELDNAIMDLMKADYRDYLAINKARERIMNAARFQKPTV